VSAGREQLATLYRETILAYAVEPCGQGKAIEATHEAMLDNPLCGDRVHVKLAIAGDTIEDAAFDGEACAICLASTSLLCRHMPGQPVNALGESLEQFKAAVNDTDHSCPEFLVPMLGVAAYPMRVACATLPWEAAVRATED